MLEPGNDFSILLFYASLPELNRILGWIRIPSLQYVHVLFIHLSLCKVLLCVLFAVTTRPCLAKQRKAKRKNKAATVVAEV